MIARQLHAPRCVYVLADILDSILAACEDLLHLEKAERAALLRLELAAITQVLQARQRIQDIDLSEPALVDQCVLFLTGTAALDLEQLRDGRSVDRQPSDFANLQVHDDYLIGRQIPLGVLAELAAAMLDALEAHFVLYAQGDGPVSAAPTGAPVEGRTVQ